jgi:hypothetical protein
LLAFPEAADHGDSLGEDRFWCTGSLILECSRMSTSGSFRVAANLFVHEAEGERVDDERVDNERNEGWMTRGDLRFTPISDALYRLLRPLLIDLAGADLAANPD